MIVPPTIAAFSFWPALNLPMDSLSVGSQRTLRLSHSRSSVLQRFSRFRSACRPLPQEPARLMMRGTGNASPASTWIRTTSTLRPTKPTSAGI